MFIMDLLLLALGTVIFPDPSVQGIFIHAEVSGGLGNRLLGFDRQFHGAFLEFGRILFHSGLTHRTPLLHCVIVLVSVCPVEYSHITTTETPLQWASRPVG